MSLLGGGLFIELGCMCKIVGFLFSISNSIIKFVNEHDFGKMCKGWNIKKLFHQLLNKGRVFKYLG